MTADVYLWWIGADAPDLSVLDRARHNIERVFGVKVRPFRGVERPTHALDPRCLRKVAEEGRATSPQDASAPARPPTPLFDVSFKLR